MHRIRGHRQHFLLSKEARTLSKLDIARMSEDEAYAAFKAIRFAENGGKPVCPSCGCLVAYEIAATRTGKTGPAKRPLYKCAGCHDQFTLTSKTIFAGRKLPYGVILYAITELTHGAKGYAALQLSRDLNVQYKTAFVLLHKMREVMAAALHKDVADRPLCGEVEIDGTYIGKKRSRNRKDRGGAGDFRVTKPQVVVVMRERGGRTLPFITKSEAEGVALAVKHVAEGTTMFADEGSGWNGLHLRFVTKRINHQEAFATDEACTNFVESYNARLKRSQFGVYHRVRGKYLPAYFTEMAWREDHRRIDNGRQYLLLMLGATHHPVSREWKGYWQRRKAA